MGQIYTHEPFNLTVRFSELRTQLTKLLQAFDPQVIVDHCCLMKASKEANIPLFSAGILEEFKESNRTATILHKLFSFTNWSDHSILYALVEVCNIPEAKTMIAKFDDEINPFHPLTKYPVAKPSHRMVPTDASTHTLLAIQCSSQLDDSTLQNVFNVRSMILGKCKVTPHCLQLQAIAETTHLMIYWSIPRHVATLIVTNILEYQNYFHQNGIEQVAVYPGTILVIGKALSVGPFSFFSKVSLCAAIIILAIHYRFQGTLRCTLN